MDVLSNLKNAKGSTKQRKRIGRGEGTGRGGTATQGMNGQKSRAGAKFRAWFEGFTNIFKINYQVVNIEKLQKLVDDKKVEGNKIDAAVLYKNNVISKAAYPYKILGKGELSAKLEVEAYGFSTSAKEKIEAAGGTIKEIKA